MAAIGYTPIQLYYSTTASAVPVNSNLANGELAINITDGKLYYKDNTGTVKVVAGTGGTGIVAGSNTQVQYNNGGVFGASSNLTFDGTSLTLGGNPTLSAGTANGVTYLNGSKVLTSGSALTFDGSTTLTVVTANATATVAKFRATNYGNLGTTYISLGTQYDDGTSRIGSVNSTGNTSQLIFETNSSTSGVWQEGMRLTSTGLGIGNNAPANKLTVAVVGNSTLNTPAAHIAIFNSNDAVNNQYYGLAFTNSNTPEGGVQKPQALISCIATGGSWSSSWAGALVFSTASGGANAAPTEKVRIAANGAIGLSGANYGTSGQVLTSQGSGSAPVWAAAAGSSQWTTTGSNIYYNTGAVGINTSTPASTANKFVVLQTPTPSGTLPTIYFPGGYDNQGSADNVGVFMQYGGGGVPNGSLLTARIGNNSAFVLNNSGSDNNIYGAGSRPPVYLYSGPSGSYNSYGQPPASSFSASASVIPRMAIYSEMTGMYDGSPVNGLSIKLAGSYGGSSTRDAYCMAVQATTAFGSDRGYGTSYGYYANVSSNISANYAFYAAAGDAAKPGGGSWTSTSDARVKTVLGQYTRGLDDVLKINVVDFEYNGKGGHTADGRRYTGVIAQEMQEIFPEMVRTHQTKLEKTDENDTDILMVDNSALVYALVNAVKELKAEFDAYKASHP